MPESLNKSTSKFGLTPEEYALEHGVSVDAVQAAIAAKQLPRALDGLILRDHPPIGLSQSQYASHRARLGLRGGTRQMVSKANADGWLVLYVDGTIDASASDRSWSEIAGSQNEGKTHDATDQAHLAQAIIQAIEVDDVPNIRAEKARRAKAEAEIARMEADKMAGLLVAASEVERRWAEITEVKRRHVMALPSRLARLVIGINDELALTTIIERECAAALMAASVEIEKLSIKGDENE